MTETSISATRTINAPVNEVFAYLTLPSNHVEVDGSGFIRSVHHGDRIQGTGDVFTMNMEGDHMGGEYQTDNHVFAFVENQVIGWKPAPAGTEPPGWSWLWRLESTGTDQTEATITYDWSEADKATVDKIGFPRVKQSALEDSLANLAEAVA